MNRLWSRMELREREDRRQPHRIPASATSPSALPAMVRQTPPVAVRQTLLAAVRSFQPRSDPSSHGQTLRAAVRPFQQRSEPSSSRQNFPSKVRPLQAKLRDLNPDRRRRSGSFCHGCLPVEMLQR